MNLKQYAPKHYVDVGLVCDWKSGGPQVLEPNKVEAWEWCDMDDLPQSLFATLPSYYRGVQNRPHILGCINV